MLKLNFYILLSPLDFKPVNKYTSLPVANRRDRDVNKKVLHIFHFILVNSRQIENRMIEKQFFPKFYDTFETTSVQTFENVLNMFSGKDFRSKQIQVENVTIYLQANILPSVFGVF